MIRNFTWFLSLSFIVMLSGCVPYHKLSKSEFPQGTNLETHYDITENFVKSQRVFEQFTTLANFDAMWLSDQTRIAYVDMYCKKRGKSSEAQGTMLERQLEENRHWISFYVLADVRDVFNGAMNDKTPDWTPYLELDGQKFEPVSIKEIELEPEYINLFGCKLNSFKTSYLVSFPAQDQAGKFYLEGCKIVKLVFSSVDKSCSVEWNLEQISKSSKSENKKIGKEIDFYWGV
ncbi:MAG: hypothetical protein WC192_03755 [Candidatus Babeliales bacterium]